MPSDAPGASGFEFHHRPGHEWWYFPDMTRRVPHSAFHARTAQATRPRHSIEFRTIAYFA
jgi:hypothetical protein